MSSDTHGLVDHLFRQQAGQMVAWLTRVFGPAHLELAEEVVQDALVKALQQWPYSGVPDNPSGWLFTVARHGALDVLRRHAAFHDRQAAVAAELQARQPAAPPSVDGLHDDELRMIFMCCHPELAPDARVALSLKTVGGFSTREIARAFLTSEATVAQRIVRAKRVIRDSRIALELPRGPALAPRLQSVLDVIYLLFNEGYAAHTGENLVRQDLCREAIRLGRLVASSRAARPAAHALVALMAFQASRIPARVSVSGEVVLLEEQDRTLWDSALVALGFAHLDTSASGAELTAFHVEAAIAAIHAAAAGAEDTDWKRVLSLYDDLLRINPSPVVRLNRAVAVSRVEGADAALRELAGIDHDGSFGNSYYLLPAVKGALLMQAGRAREAAAAYREALARPCSEPERRLLARRRRDALCAASAPDAESDRVLGGA